MLCPFIKWGTLYKQWRLTKKELYSSRSTSFELIVVVVVVAATAAAAAVIVVAKT